MSRVESWLAATPQSAATITKAGGKDFVRLMVPHRWSISQKDFPTHWIGGRQKEDLISAIGYGDTLDEALDEAFDRLPG